MKRFVAMSIIFIFIISVGCVEKVAPKPSTREYLVYNIGSLPEDLLLLDTYDVRSKDLILSLFQGLVKKDEKGNVLPGLAEKWLIGKDDITYTFTLRKGAQFSDGTEIKAEDFVQFFGEFLKPKRENVYASELFYVFGAEEYRTGKKQLKEVGINAIDEHTLQIRLNAPCSYFLDILCEPAFCLRKIDSSLKEYKNHYRDLKYTGPFQITEISKEGEVTLIKNNKYWNKEEVKSDKIVLTSIEYGESALASFESGKIDILVDPPLSEIPRLLCLEKAISEPLDTGESLVFNLGQESMGSSPNFRRAISYSINRSDITSTVLEGVERVAETYVPLKGEGEKEGQKKTSIYESDILQGKQFLENSLYDKSKKIRLVYEKNNKNKKVCEAIEERVKSTLEVPIEAIGYEKIELKEIIKKGEYDILKTEYIGMFDDPLALLENWSSTSIFNVNGYKDLQYEEFLMKARIGQKGEERKQLIGKCEKILQRDIPTVPLYFNNIILCKNKEIEGLSITPLGNVKLEKVYKTSSK